MTAPAAPRSYPRIRVSGGPAERSFRYGELAREQILLVRAGYERAFAARGVDWGRARERASAHLPAIRQHFPGLLTELEGIAGGSGLPFEDVLAMNCRTEILWEQTARAAAAVAPWLRGECSAFALTPARTAEARTLVGQNWDWLQTLAGGVIVLEVERPDGPNYVTVVEAGLLAKTTLTQSGLAIAINTLACSLDGGRDGVPFHVLVRALADAEHAFDAVELLAGVPRASSGNYLIGTADGAALTIEAAPGDVRTVQPIAAENGTVLHTNHFLRPVPGAHDLAPTAMPDSYVRHARLRDLIAEPAGPLSVDDLRAALTDHADHPSSVCCHPDDRAHPDTRWATLASVIMEPATATLRLAPGAPCETPWETLDYSELLA